jgi:hypothetical protein
MGILRFRRVGVAVGEDFVGRFKSIDNFGTLSSVVGHTRISVVSLTAV